MKKILYLLLCVLAVATLAIPPWNMDWKTLETKPEAESMRPDRFVGWHDWSFITEEHGQTIAWDGENTGGKIGYQGTPSVAYGIYLSEILAIILIFISLQIVTRKKKLPS